MFIHVCVSVYIFFFQSFSLMETAKEIMKECLPIKCLEAVILAVYPSILTFNVCFPSMFPTEIRIISDYFFRTFV